MNKPLLLMDFDRTLFDTDRFFVALWQLVADTYDGIDAHVEMARKKDFLTYVGDLYDYSFHTHIADALGEQYEREAFAMLVQDRLSGMFLFDDATPALIARIDRIVTYGNEPYQSLKLSLCPELADIPTDIVHVPKAEFIAANFTQPTILVDDKAIWDEMLPPARFIWLNRGGDTAIVNHENHVAISSLRFLQDAIDKR